MIVCVCNNVSDRKIRQAAEEGMTTLADLRKHLDVGTCCGKCHSCAKQVLRECQETVSILPFSLQAMAA
ncbi:(2Fe-2S)-binding protein [Paucimonas lemoignei]|nr:(2Fe-2S)-binding protein [Paucimonas lemoignei]